MPPSGWHDQTRDAGHDDLQNQVIEWAFKNQELLAKRFAGSHVSSLKIEAPLVMKDRSGRRYIGAFADVMAVLTKPGEPYKHNPSSTAPPEKMAIIWEVKPRIYSAGSAIRQAEATAFEFWKSDIADYQGAEPVRRLLVQIIFPHDDPKRDVLENMLGYCKGISAMAWDVATGKPRA